MHDCFLDHSYERANSKWLFEHLDALNLLLIEVRLNVFFISVYSRNLNDSLIFDVVSDCRNKQELRLFWHFVEKRVHAKDNLSNQFLIRVVHILQNSTKVNICFLIVDCSQIMGAVDGHKVDVEARAVVCQARVIELFNFVVRLLLVDLGCA